MQPRRQVQKCWKNELRDEGNGGGRRRKDEAEKVGWVRLFYFKISPMTFLSIHTNCWVHQQCCWVHLATPYIEIDSCYINSSFILMHSLFSFFFKLTFKVYSLCFFVPQFNYFFGKKYTSHFLSLFHNNTPPFHAPKATN